MMARAMREQGRGEMPRSPLRKCGRLPTCCQSNFANARRSLQAIKQTQPEIWLKDKSRRLALDAGRRRTRKQLGVPVARDRVRFKNRGAVLDLNQHDNGRRDCHGRCRMHHDAQRTVVCVRVYLVHVHHLHHGQQGKQNQADHGHQRQ